VAESARELGLRPWWLVAGMLLCAAGGAAWQARGPAMYRAVCVLDYGKEPVSVAGGAQVTGPESEEWYRTQDIVLGSYALAERVVETLRLANDRSFTGPVAQRGPASARTAAALKLQERLSITPLPETHAVRVAVDDTNPKRAAFIANAVADAYLKKAFEDRVAASQRALAWLDEQIGGTGRRLAQTEVEIQTYLERQEGPAVPPTERQGLLFEEISRLTQSLTDARLARIELSARLTKLRGATQSGNPFDAHAREFDESDEVKQLRAVYLALLFEQARALPESVDKLPQPLGQKKLDALWSRMENTLEGIVRGTQAELTAVQQVETQLHSALDRANAAGHTMRRQELEYARLNRERSDAEGWLKALRERSSAAGVTMAAGVLSARVIDPATPPLTPLAPPLFGGAVVGGLTGLLLSGLVLALIQLAQIARAYRADRPEPAEQPPNEPESTPASGP
jgi:polysaccharide biosynthesis transport protein